jgi:aquaporin Z
MREALKNHWREYLIEAWCLGAFMVSACAFGVVLFHPASPSVEAFGWTPRNVLMGVAMGATAVGIILSPWGRRSGAHFNPAVTLAFWRLGKIRGADALFYILAHFAGGVAGVLLAWLALGNALSDATVNFVVTVPGTAGAGVAFLVEAVISFLMMTVILVTSNSARLAQFTPYFAGFLVALFISLEAPISGMSMNPARTFASALVANHWNSIWIYFAAPPLAMLAAAEVFARVRGLRSVVCAKLHHRNSEPCIFVCGYASGVRQTEEFIEATKNRHLFSNVSSRLF